MQEILNKVEEILSEIDKSINQPLLRMEKTYQVECQCL